MTDAIFEQLDFETEEAQRDPTVLTWIIHQSLES
jgi:hypothetical protein